MTNLLAKTQKRARVLGHDVTWDVVTTVLAYGQCRKCSLRITVSSPDGVRLEVHGLVDTHCPASVSD